MGDAVNRLPDAARRRLQGFAGRLGSGSRDLPMYAVRPIEPANLQWGSLGTTDDRIRVTRSLGEAVTAMVVWETLDEADRVETLGEWARLLP